MKTTHRFILILMAITWFAVAANLNGETLKLVRVIEDNDENFLSVTSDATLTECKDIIILDGVGHSLSRYNWEGEFISRIGRQGAGPGDFSYPDSVCFHNGRIYVHDTLNYRIVETDSNLGNLKFFPLPKNRHNGHFQVLNSNAFIFGSISLEKVAGNRISIFTRDGNAVESFFSNTPVDVKRIATKSLGNFAFLTAPQFALDQQRKNLLVAFISSDNPIKFYLYNLTGKPLSTFDYQLEKKYKFQVSLYQGKRLSFAKFKGRHFFSVSGIHNLKGNWYVFITTNHYPDGDYKLTSRNRSQYVKNHSFYLKFNELGKFLERVDIEPFFVCFEVSEDGYVLGSQPEAEIENVVIYKIVD